VAAAGRLLASGEPLLLDLSGVLFADREGIAALRALEPRGVVLTGSSPLVREMMAAEPTPDRADEATGAADGEAELVEALRRGDEAAFEAVVKQHSGRMLSAARRLLGSEDDAYDAVQDAFISAFRAIDRFSGTARLSTWLHRIVVNAALMKLRRRRRKPEESIDDFLPRFDDDGRWSEAPSAWSTSSDALLARREDRDLVRAAIAELPETYRTVLVLRDIEERDTEEVAK